MPFRLKVLIILVKSKAYSSPCVQITNITQTGRQFFFVNKFISLRNCKRQIDFSLGSSGYIVDREMGALTNETGLIENIKLKIKLKKKRRRNASDILVFNLFFAVRKHFSCETKLKFLFQLQLCTEKRFFCW